MGAVSESDRPSVCLRHYRPEKSRGCYETNYTSADFINGNVWRLRGKLDVPKERWVSFPHCEGEDGTLLIAWAGYDHLQLARAMAERHEQAKEHEGRKLVPLLASIGQLIPWLKQWHNELDPAFGARMGDYFEGYLAEEAKPYA